MFRRYRQLRVTRRFNHWTPAFDMMLCQARNLFGCSSCFSLPLSRLPLSPPCLNSPWTNPGRNMPRFLTLGVACRIKGNHPEWPSSSCHTELVYGATTYSSYAWIAPIYPSTPIPLGRCSLHKSTGPELKDRPDWVHVWDICQCSVCCGVTWTRGRSEWCNNGSN